MLRVIEKAAAVQNFDFCLPLNRDPDSIMPPGIPRALLLAKSRKPA
jgi:hypothetical protein